MNVIDIVNTYANQDNKEKINPIPNLNRLNLMSESSMLTEIARAGIVSNIVNLQTVNNTNEITKILSKMLNNMEEQTKLIAEQTKILKKINESQENTYYDEADDSNSPL